MAVDKGEKEVVVEVDAGAGVAAKEVPIGDMITLQKSSDGKTFEVSKEAAERLSKFLKEKISSGGLADGGIQLEKIGSEALEKVVDNLNKHADTDPSCISFVDSAASKDLEEWDRELVDGLSTGAFFDLLQAADYLGIGGLLDVTCRKIADMITGKTPVQIREMFNIKNDYTPEQEEEVRLENAWAFDDKDEDEE